MVRSEKDVEYVKAAVYLNVASAAIARISQSLEERGC